MRLSLRIAAAAAVLALALVAWMLADLSTARAAAGPWAENAHSRVRLIAASEAVGEQGEVLLGLQFELQPGWKTYWRAPGDAGYPPKVDWSASANLATFSSTSPRLKSAYAHSVRLPASRAMATLSRARRSAS